MLTGEVWGWIALSAAALGLGIWMFVGRRFWAALYDRVRTDRGRAWPSIVNVYFAASIEVAVGITAACGAVYHYFIPS